MADETQTTNASTDAALTAFVATLSEKDAALVQSLIQDLAIEKASADELSIHIVALTGDKEAAEVKAASLEAKVTALQADLADASGVIDGQVQTIKEQEAKIIALQTTPAAFPTFMVGKSTYEVQGKSFKYKSKDYTVADLLADKALQKELVGKGVGFLIEKKEA